jgi:hypothetical protein
VKNFLRTAISPKLAYFEPNGQLNIFLEISRHKKSPQLGAF